MKKYIFISAAIIISSTLQNCSDAPEASDCIEKIDRIINQVSIIVDKNSSKSDAFKAQIIAFIATATIDSGSPRIHGIPEKISLKEAESRILAAFATLQRKSYDTSSAFDQSRALYIAAQQYKATI